MLTEQIFPYILANIIVYASSATTAFLPKHAKKKKKDLTRKRQRKESGHYLF
jgi:hypothetical protein